MHTAGAPQDAFPSNSGNGASDNDPVYFNNFKISYFLGVNVPNDSNPKMLLAGDRNIVGYSAQTSVPAIIPNNGYGNANGFEYGLGSTNFPLNATAPAWTPAKMHQGRGNVLLADDSVQQLDSAGLRRQLGSTGDSTFSPGQNTLLFP
jgi:hypothetical protein